MQGRAPVLVIGGGIAGLSAAVELADAGCPVILIEKSPSLGGRVAGLHQYFPKLCPPACGLEMHYRRLRANPSITVHTLAEVTEIISAQEGYDVVVRIDPRYVTEACTSCAVCSGVCPVERPDQFNCGLSTTKAIYLPHTSAYPARFVIDRARCATDCRACQNACSYSAVDLNQKPELKHYFVSGVVAATGWAPYDASRIENLGFGRCANVVTNVMLERMAASDGPTGGRILRPSDRREPHTVAFVQCAGSRDENHLPYCSAVCCSASIKHAAYIRALYPETAISVFYIDLRTPGHLENFQTRIVEEAGLRLIRGKAAVVEENPATGDLLVTAEDTLTGQKQTMNFELVVLATGMVPQTGGLPAAFSRDECGFLIGANGRAGLNAAGCVHRPGEVSSVVRDATGAALKALQCANGSVGRV